MDKEISEVDVEALIKKMYGSIKSFTKEKGLRYYHTMRAINNPGSKAYADTIKQIAAFIFDDAQKIDTLKRLREDLRVKILIQYPSLMAFSNAFDVDYMMLWRYIKGKSLDMQDELRAAFISAGFMNEKKAA